MNKFKFKDRLQQAMNKKNIKAVELSEKTYLSKSAISQYLSGYSVPKTDRTYIIAKALGVDPAWLIGYDVEMEAQEPNEPVDIFKIPGVLPPPSGKKVPIIGSIACGTPILAQENIDAYIDVGTKEHIDFALRCTGESMQPKFFDDDVVLIIKQDVVDNGQIAAVLIGDEATLKRVYIEESQIILSAENPAFPPIVYQKEEMNTIRILGRAIGFVRFFV